MEMIKLFDDYEILLTGFNKAKYIKNMQVFKEKYKDMLIALSKESEEGYRSFAEAVYNRFSFMGKVGKMKKKDLNLFMIYYIFPAMLLIGQDNNEKEEYVLSCDKLLETWNSVFETDISYLEYPTILEGFNDKLFGVF